MEGGRVNHRWCMCVVSHDCSGLGEDRDEDGSWYVCRMKPKGLGCMLGDVRALPECEVNSLVSPITPPSRCAALGKVEPELVAVAGKALTHVSTRRLRFDVHAVGWLHSMGLHGRGAADYSRMHSSRKSGHYLLMFSLYVTFLCSSITAFCFTDNFYSIHLRCGK